MKNIIILTIVVFIIWWFLIRKKEEQNVSPFNVLKGTELIDVTTVQPERYTIAPEVDTLEPYGKELKEEKQQPIFDLELINVYNPLLRIGEDHVNGTPGLVRSNTTQLNHIKKHIDLKIINYYTFEHKSNHFDVYLLSEGIAVAFVNNTIPFIKVKLQSGDDLLPGNHSHKHSSSQIKENTYTAYYPSELGSLIYSLSSDYAKHSVSSGPVTIETRGNRVNE